MNDDVETGERTWSFDTCPCCSTSVSVVTVVGPTDGIAGPCGCHVSPAIFEDEAPAASGPRDRSPLTATDRPAVFTASPNPVGAFG